MAVFPSHYEAGLQKNQARKRPVNRNFASVSVVVRFCKYN